MGHIPANENDGSRIWAYRRAGNWKDAGVVRKDSYSIGEYILRQKHKNQDKRLHFTRCAASVYLNSIIYPQWKYFFTNANIASGLFCISLRNVLSL